MWGPQVLTSSDLFFLYSGAGDTPGRGGGAKEQWSLSMAPPSEAHRIEGPTQYTMGDFGRTVFSGIVFPHCPYIPLGSRLCTKPMYRDRALSLVRSSCPVPVPHTLAVPEVPDHLGRECMPRHCPCGEGSWDPMGWPFSLYVTGVPKVFCRLWFPS